MNEDCEQTTIAFSTLMVIGNTRKGICAENLVNRINN